VTLAVAADYGDDVVGNCVHGAGGVEGVPVYTFGALVELGHCDVMDAGFFLRITLFCVSKVHDGESGRYYQICVWVFGELSADD